MKKIGAVLLMLSIVFGCTKHQPTKTLTTYTIESSGVYSTLKPEERIFFMVMSNDKQRVVIYQQNPPAELVSFAKNLHVGEKIHADFYIHTSEGKTTAEVRQIINTSNGARYDME